MVVVNTFTAPADGIVHQQMSTKLYVNEREIGCGTLYITESLIWTNLCFAIRFDPSTRVRSISDDFKRYLRSLSQLSWCDLLRCIGFSMRYMNICLHAIRREPYPSLYVMLDYKLQLPEGFLPPEEAALAQQIEESSSDDDEEMGEPPHELTELTFAPEDQDMLQRMFSAMSECQALHPDPNDDDSDEYDAASVMFDDESFEPVPHDLQNPEQYMQGLHIGVNNGHSLEDSPGEATEEMEHDPEQFADD